MIYYEYRSLFIHIPRTSGLSVAKAVLSQKDPEHSGVNVILGHGLGPFWRHAPAQFLKDALPEWASPRLKKFTIIRNPWRICESTFRQFRWKFHQVTSGACSWFDVETNRTLKRCSTCPFADFVLSHFQYLRRGFFAHWGLEWGSYRDLGVEAFRFEELERYWPRLCKWMQLPVGTPRPWENAAPPVETVWTEPAMEFIQERCELDFDLFGYPRHP
jgi:hypothetical protein